MSTKTTTTTTTVGGRSAVAVSGEFDVAAFEQKLRDLKDTQESIQHLSAWCLQRRAHHKKIVTSWLNILKQVKIESRLTLFYLANDVIQYSKRKNYEFVDSWGTYLQKATTLVRDEKVKHKILRIFKIWEQREVYNEEFLSDLNGLLSVTTSSAKKQQQQQQQQQQSSKPHNESNSQHHHQHHHHHAGQSQSASGAASLSTSPAKVTESKTSIPISLNVDDYQASVLVTSIRDCVRNEGETDLTFKNLNKKPLVEVEVVMGSIKGKDRKRVEEVEQEIEDQVEQYSSYVDNLKTELTSRRMLLTVLEQAKSFYSNQRSEVKVVVNAYRNFGNRLKSMKKRLDEVATTLPSPIPSPDINAPSPGPSDVDIVLPDEQSYFQMHHHSRSYMDGGSLPFDLNDFNRSDSPSVMHSGYHGPPSGAANSGGMAGGGNNVGSVVGGIVAPPQPPPGIVPHPVGPYGGGVGGGGVGGSVINPWATSTPHGPSNRPGTGNNIFRPPPYANQALMSDYGSPQPGAGGRQSTASLPLLPPPMPQINLDTSDEYNSTWDMPMTWDGTHDSSGFQSLDAPVSPSQYDRKSMNASGMLIDYGDDGSSGVDGRLQDVDHRQLSNSLVMPPFLKDKGRLADVDHRNLISLTGSPGSHPVKGRMMGSSVMDDDGHDSLLNRSGRSGGPSSGGGQRIERIVPQPVPAPSDAVASGHTAGQLWTGNDVDMRLGSSASSSSLTVVVPSTAIGDSSNAAGSGEESKDLDMRIQSLEKAIAAQIANNGANGDSTLSRRFDALDGSDGIASGSRDGHENSSQNSVASGDVNGGDDVPAVDGGVDDGELSLPTLQTPVSLLEIDDFLQNFERERCDLTKPPAVLMSNQTESSQSPPPTSENSGTGDDVPKNPIDNTESVDMDLSDEEASDQQRHSHDDGPTAGQAGREVNQSVDENSREAVVTQESAKPDADIAAAATQQRLAGKAMNNGNGSGGSSTSINSNSNNSSSTNSILPPLLVHHHQPPVRPPLLPDPTFGPGQRPKWDLPPPSLMSLPGLGGFSNVPPPGIPGNLNQPPPTAALTQIWAEQPPPVGPGDVPGLFGSPNRPPPPLPFGGSPMKGGNYRGGGRGVGHNRGGLSPYYRGGLGGVGMRGGYRGGGGGNKFRGGVGGPNNRSGW
ncbi:uncharacterized protein LOC118457633 isoform X2 [Anopheles albimanus]|uniref:Regulation of nuclear pre-mRNA domain-containing protein 2 n=1 Tax=Anopheles albimanus TaxID=7167 RepID=A0A182F3X2_ANOAL|nr:uncharacterized protein LOC118457633 isoform X2 [Anopheles albimanus]